MTKICECGHNKSEHTLTQWTISDRYMIDKFVITKCRHIRKNVKFHHKNRKLAKITFVKDVNCICSQFYEMEK
tara:strand:- start:74 stop:292 length:219 start_codon:yes stop_codon:yes gene_type:complete